MERVYTTPLLDKLGVRPGVRIAIVGALHEDKDDAADFRSQLESRTSDITDGTPKSDTDLVFLAADTTDELEALARLRSTLKPNGAIWVVSRKGKAATLRDVEVIAAALDNDLVDNKVVSFSPTRTALRLVIPVALRPRA
jgi:trans-aconitate methyltransferase